MTDRVHRALTSFMQRSDDDIVAAALRLRHVTHGLSEAHRIGCRPTDPDAMSLDMVAKEFTRIYSATQTPGLAEAGAQWARAISAYMTVRGSPPGVSDEWIFVAEFLARMADAYRGSDGEDELSPEDLPADAGAQVYTLDYRALGAIFPERLLTRLFKATVEVERALLCEQNNNPLSGDEIILLQGVVAGRSISNLAADLNYSERSISRSLRTIWERVGAASRAEGIATIIAHGWLNAPNSSTAERSSRQTPTTATASQGR